MAKTYVRRTPEQVVAQLEAQIAAVKARAAAKEVAAEVKGSPDGVAFLAAVKAADRAIRVAGEHKNDAMQRALEAARAPLAEHLVGMGLRRRIARRAALAGGRRREARWRVPGPRAGVRGRPPGEVQAGAGA